MKYLKSFNSVQEQKQYMSNHWFTPYIHMFTNKTLDYEQKYISVEYISSTQTGGQYIDLGCHLLENTDDIKIDIKFNIKGHGKTGIQQSTFIASQPEISPYPGFTMRIGAYDITDDKIVVTFNNKWMCSTDWITFIDENKKTRWCYKYMVPMGNYHQPVGGGLTTSLNEVHEYSILLDNIPNSQINNTTCTLFCALDSSNNPFRYVEADLYYLRFTKGDNVVRDLIPCINPKGIAGLYDKVNKKFYKSEGDEEFVAGPSI